MKTIDNVKASNFARRHQRQRIILSVLVVAVLAGILMEGFSGMPVESPFENLTLVAGTPWAVQINPFAPPDSVDRVWIKRILGYEKMTSLNQLKGRITVRTPQEALGFVRLRTSLWDTVRFVPISMEVHPAPLNNTPKFAAPAGSAGSVDADQGYYGEVSSPQALAAISGFPKVEATSGGFTVSRVLIIRGMENTSDRSFMPMLVVEHVGRDGGWNLVSTTELNDPRLAGIKWVLPWVG